MVLFTPVAALAKISGKKLTIKGALLKMEDFQKKKEI